MTNKVKNQVLKYLYNQKLFGIKYHSDLNINFYSSCDFALPNSLEELKKSVTNCYLCDLSKTRKHTLFGYGSQNSKIMFICDEPSKSEDDLGSFFVGNSGYLLKQIEVIKPKIIVAVGERVHDYLLKSSGEFLKNRGKVLSFNSAILVPIFSPLYLLKNPSLKKDTYLDMLKIKNLYEES